MLTRIGFAAVAALALSSPAAAAEACGTWTAGMVEDEGGPVMMATTCTLHEEMQSDLLVMCGGEKSLYLRYLSGLVAESPPSNTETGYQGEFEIASGKAVETVKMVYEEMDGAVTLSTPFDGPIAKMLNTGETLSIKSKDGFFKPDSFALKGAPEAIKKLQSTCQ